MGSTSHAASGVLAIESLTSGFIEEPMPGDGNDPQLLDSSVQNYQAGYNATTDKVTRNWFIFEVPGLAPGESIASATVSLYMPIFIPGEPSDFGFGYDSTDPSEDFSLFGLSPSQLGDSGFISPAKILDDDGIPDDGGLFDAYFSEITLGIELGGATVEGADNGTFVTIDFMPTGLAHLTASVGGDYLIGGAIMTLGDAPAMDEAAGIFHHTHPHDSGPPGGDTPVPVLSIVIIPEPSVSALLGMSMLAMLLKRGR